ncbi:MAG: chemotaxis protein CheA [Oligoflexales bacterium]
MDQSDLLNDLLATFTDELGDIVEHIEQTLLIFEKDSSNNLVIDELFRYFHNVKGSSKTIGLTGLSSYAHDIEHILSLLRSGEMNATPALIDKLLESSDLLRSYFVQLSSGPKSETSEMVEDLENFRKELKKVHSSEGDKQQTDSMQDEKSSKDANTEDSAASHAPEASRDQSANEPSEESSDSEAYGVFYKPKKKEATKPNESKVQKPAAPKPKQTAAQNQAGQQRLETIKIPLNRIDELMELFGEQVILQSSLDHILEQDLESQREFIEQTVTSLKKITQDLRYTMVNLRMVPISPLYARLERAVRDTAKITGKPIKFVKEGQSSELDKSIVDSLVDPLTHMVRNAVDHGIEDEETRLKNGKQKEGVIILSAGRNGGSFEIILRDDGKGLDREAIIEKATKSGLITGDPSNLSDNEVYNLIFNSGFSTRQEATEISGRGVGMDVVNEKLKQLKGTCQIKSEKNKGTEFTIKVPQSLAMFNGTIILVNNERYVIPNSDFHETIALSPDTLKLADSNFNKIRLEERILTVLDLREILAINYRKEKGNAKSKNYHLALITRFENQEYALLVSDIISQEQIVLKELTQEVNQIKESCGGTILGDGKVALVLDLRKLIAGNKRSPKLQLAG